MKIFSTLLFSILFAQLLWSQNLVPNPSFEQYKRRPAAMLDEGLEFTRAVPAWVSPNRASSDFITPRFRSSKVQKMPPHDGDNMVGIVIQGAHWAEYASTKLKEPLEVGKKYYVEFWISAPPFYNKNATGTPLFNDHFGMLFDKRLYFTDTKIIQKKPQIIAHTGTRLAPTEWKKINGTFIANNAFTHIYIGQFLNKNNPENIIEGYFFIDDIFVEKIEKEAEQFEPSKTYQINGKVASIVMENIYFETDKYELLPESFQELNKLVKIMKDHRSMTINIKGHTDSEGGKDHNQILSENRANSVHDYLVQQGISKDRLAHEGHGLSQPVAENTSNKGRQKNRRVELETKTQDTVGQGVILVDLAYPFSKTISKNPSKLINIGKDERHLDCAQMNPPTVEITKEYRELLKSFGQYKPITAKNFVLEKTKNATVVHLQTDVLHPEQQFFILELLEKWYEQGFRYIGFENIKNIAAIAQRGYPTFGNGKQFEQPIFGELIRQGHRMGFHFFTLTPTEKETNKALSILKKQRFQFQNQPKKQAAQKWASAMNVNRILRKNKNAKVLLFSHDVDEVKTGTPSTLAFWLKKLANQEVLSIGQSSTYIACAKTQTPLSKKMKITRPTIFQKRKTVLVPLRYDEGSQIYRPHDIHIYHPKNSFEHNRLAFLFSNKKRKPFTLNIDKYKMSYPCLVFAYKKGEDINKAIPIDVIELSDNQDDTPLALPDGEYEIVLRDRNKWKKMVF